MARCHLCGIDGQYNGETHCAQCESALDSAREQGAADERAAIVKMAMRIFKRESDKESQWAYTVRTAALGDLVREIEARGKPPSDTPKVVVDPTMPAGQVRMGDVRVVNIKPPSASEGGTS